MEHVSISISVISLVVSLGTFWLAFLRGGALKMTTPTIIFFGYDVVPKVTPKVFLRTLLYCTAIKGKIVEGMYVSVRHRDSEQVFGFWGYGETEKLTHGSGLYVSKTGVSANHHFVLSVHASEYAFDAGDHLITVFARIVGDKKPTQLAQIVVNLKPELADALGHRKGVLFERTAEGQYEGHTQHI